MKKLGIMLFFLIVLVPLISSVPPFAECEQTNEGYLIENPINYYIEQGVGRYFRFQVVDSISGLTLNDSDGINCTFNMLDKDGTFLVQNSSVPYGNGSWYVYVEGTILNEPKHITTGIKCTNGSLGGIKPTEFEITETGSIYPESAVIVFLMIYSVFVFLFILYSLIKILQDIVEVRANLITVSWGFSSYIANLSLYYFLYNFMPMGLMLKLSLICMGAFGITHIFLPLIGLLISWIKARRVG